MCSENKGADQLHGYREADLRLRFRICKKKKNVFLVTRLKCFRGFRPLNYNPAHSCNGSLKTRNFILLFISFLLFLSTPPLRDFILLIQISRMCWLICKFVFRKRQRKLYPRRDSNEFVWFKT